MLLFKEKKLSWERLLHFRLHSKYMLYIVYGLFVALFISGLYQKLYKSVDGRIQFHAVPVAISTLYQGHKHDYRGWLSTERPFQGVKGVLTDSFIKRQIKAPVHEEEGHYHWTADDRGFTDFVIAAFALFGPKMISLYFFWFLLLFLSLTFFILSFRSQTWALAYLALLLLGLHSAMSLLKLIHVAQPVYDLRYLEVLAIVPILHMIFVVVFVENKDFLKHLGPLIGQLAIFVFLYHARSSLGWEILAVVLISLMYSIARKDWNKIKIPIGVSTLLILSCTLLLSSYKHFTYHQSYFEEIGSRTFWHNVLMGVPIDNTLLDNVPSDRRSVEIVLEYAKKSGCSAELMDSSPQDFLNSFGCWGTVDWVEYEYWAKKLFFFMLKENKVKFAKLYFITKPMQALRDVIYPRQILFSGEESTQIYKRTLPWNPTHLAYLVPLLFILIGANYSLPLHKWNLLVISFLVFVCGMIPPVAFYSDITTHGGMSVMMVVILYQAMFLTYSYVNLKIKNYNNRLKANTYDMH